MMVTVPKKKRKRAVDRVLIRRRIREAFRLNSGGLKTRIESQPDIASLSLSLIYIHNENIPYSVIEEKMKCLLDRMESKIAHSPV